MSPVRFDIFTLFPSLKVLGQFRRDTCMGFPSDTNLTLCNAGEDKLVLGRRCSKHDWAIGITQDLVKRCQSVSASSIGLTSAA